MSAIRDRSKIGDKLQQWGGQALTASAITLTPVKEISALRIFNTSPSKVIKYSIDGGTTYLSIMPLGIIDEYYRAKTILLKTASGSANVDVEVTYPQ